MIPQIENIENEEIKVPSKTYKLNINENQEDRIIGFVDEIEAIKQTVYHILSVERYSYDIYDDDYGVELEQYVGQSLDYIEATIEDTLDEALTQDERIIGVEVTNIEKIDTDNVLIKFNVLTQSEEIEMEVGINV